MGKTLVGSSNKKGEKDLIGEIVQSLPPNLNGKYLAMSRKELDKLPSFNEDGSVVMYDIGDGYLLGKLALLRYVKTMNDNSVTKL